MRHTNGLWIWLIVVVSICAAYFLVMYYWFPGNLEKRGQFGDMFGALGALFSGLAFAGLIVTIRQQREDLKNQRDEIELQREDLKSQTEALNLQKEEIRQTNEELKLQRKEMEEQNKTIMLQRFETTLFNMLKNQMGIRDAIKYSDGQGDYEGKEAVERIYQIGSAKIRKNGYNDHFIKYHMSHYIRHLIQTLKIIDVAGFLSYQEKCYYTEIVGSHMSMHELCAFFYYCLSDEGKEKAKILVEKYALFKSLNNGETFSKDELSLFSDGAFTQKEG